MKINKAQVGTHGTSLTAIAVMAYQLFIGMGDRIDQLELQTVNRCEIEAVLDMAMAEDQANLAESARDVANRYVTLSENEPLSQSNQLRLEQKRLQEQQFLAEETRLLGLAEAACDG